MTPSVLLAIESSCDDTAAAVLKEGLLASSVVASQRVHAGFGGVVPELASRAHQRLIVPTVEAALEEAGVTAEDVDAVAVTYGPGLAGSLLVGLSYAKGLALGLGVPLMGVNHLEGHVYSVFVREQASEPVPDFPFLCLTVSGGHTQLTVVREGFRHDELGRTRDDAAGEAFDKVAKMLGLGYPGGPAIDQLAAEGDAGFLDLPTPLLPEGRTGEPFAFSFSGLKTAVLYHLRALGDAEREAHLQSHRADLAASFQTTVVDALVEALGEGARRTGLKDVAIVGGVSANRQLRRAAQERADADGLRLFVPPMAYSVDNAAMIGQAGWFRLQAGPPSPLTLAAAPSLKL